MSSPPLVFLGPSLPRIEAQRLLPEAVFLPPIKRSSLKPFRTDPPSAIGIVDGEFYQSLAVSPKEILPFLECGIPVFGASSIGALRAVELAPYGMTGVGGIFQAYASGAVDADDEVAMTYCRETLRPLSEPLINFRVALKQATACGMLSATEAGDLLVDLKSLYFPERTITGFFALAAQRLPASRFSALRHWWESSAPNAKASDAAELLVQIADCLKK